MLIEHFILARNSSIDQETKNLSIFEFIEDIQIQSTGGTIALPLQLVAVVRRENEVGALDLNFGLEISGPAPQPALIPNIKIRMEANHSRSRLRVNLQAPITGGGLYKFSLRSSDGRNLMASIQIQISLVTAANPQELPKA